jgi:hypothetical protein
VFTIFSAVDKHSDGSFALKTLKQKLFVDGLCYLIQEIYGVERKSNEEVIDEEIDDTGHFLKLFLSSPNAGTYLRYSSKCEISQAGLWIRIDSIRIGIQQLNPNRIQIHKVIEYGSAMFPDRIQI